MEFLDIVRCHQLFGGQQPSASSPIAFEVNQPLTYHLSQFSRVRTILIKSSFGIFFHCFQLHRNKVTKFTVTCDLIIMTGIVWRFQKLYGFLLATTFSAVRLKYRMFRMTHSRRDVDSQCCSQIESCSSEVSPRLSNVWIHTVFYFSIDMNLVVAVCNF